MKNMKDYMFYLFNTIILFLISLISFEGMVISTLSYILTCNIIKNR